MLHPELRLRAAVAQLLDTTPAEPLEPLPGLPPTPEQQQQARRLAEAGVRELARIKEVLEPRRPPKETKPRAKDPTKAWMGQGGRSSTAATDQWPVPASQHQARAGSEACS
ncbi:hypothetical protein [Stenotrophomonas maltophilia]|uniref:hypothetical protein n=1 Tax=Stenotrophomonas maltophilia TaxID=40324 RepID=UPI003D2F8F1A